MDILTVTNPYDGNEISKLRLDSYEDVQKKIINLHQFFLKNCGPVNKVEKVKTLEKFKDLVLENKESLIELAISEGGKPIKDTIIEFTRAVDGINQSIIALKKLRGDIIPMGETYASSGHFAYTIFTPLGVCLAVSAFNHPLNLIIHQMLSAYISGCPLLMRPALKTPLSCKKLVELFHQAGASENECIFSLFTNEDCQKLVSQKQIAFFSFIGHYSIGEMLQRKLPEGSKYCLEHGGTAPVVIDIDVEIDQVLPGLIKASYYHGGQVCVSAQNIFIHENIFLDFQKKYLKLAKNLVVGDPKIHETDIGPMITIEAKIKFLNTLENAKKRGVNFILESTSFEGNLVGPSIALIQNLQDSLLTNEIFAPHVNLISYTDLDLLIDYLNTSEYSFQSSFYSRNINLVNSVISKLYSKAILINQHPAFRVDWMPFGGVKKSGFGISGYEYAIKDMSLEKLIVINQN
ncbi:MAG: aldehyde dehydrogenase family protein [Halobacteriovoraceae bacterium]|nr:aldehyde dehydrogenase family protein [Halobacteriovoraceae bacterium]